MSNVSDRHNIIPFVSGVTKPLSGQVLVKVGSRQTAKMSEKGLKAKPTVCASVPVISNTEILENASAFLLYMKDAITEARKEILDAARDKGESAVTTEMVSLQSCLLHIQMREQMTEEFLREWMEEHKEAFVAFACECFKFDIETLNEEQLKKVNQAFASWTSVLTDNVAKKKGAYLNEKQRQQFRKLMNYASDEFQDTGSARLTRFMEACDKKDADEANALGMDI